MSRIVFDSNELAELDCIATATERIADALEELGRLLNASSKNISSIDEQHLNGKNEQPIKEPLLTGEDIADFFK